MYGDDDDDGFSALMTVNMAAYLETEKRIAGGGAGAAPGGPAMPKEDDCCNEACARCVWVVYAEECRRFAAREASLAAIGEDDARSASAESLPAAPMAVLASRAVAPGIHYIECEARQYATADTLVVHSPNPDALVARCAARLSPPIDVEALRWGIELSLPPPRALFEALLLRCADDGAAAAQHGELQRILVREHYGAKYSGGARAAARDDARVFGDVAQVLEAFDAARLSSDALADAVGARKPRSYTICTADAEQPAAVGIVFRVGGS
jgi:hypothetical protein